MRRLALRVIGLTAGILAAFTMWIVMTLPPAAQHPDVPEAPPTFVTGAYHIHSNRSDGSGSVDQIAQAAARAGLQFVIITDHGDATRTPDPPAYLHGVLVIDAVEISTASGHLVALNLKTPSPYPLAGEARDVIEDVHRLGGWAVAAHPESPRPNLRWRGGAVDLDGIEWLNVDSEWRGVPSGPGVSAEVARAWFRGPETIASLFQSNGAGLERWDLMLRTRHTFSLAAVDAHARVGEDLDAGRTSHGLSLSWPSYETMFRTVTQTVVLKQAWSKDPRSDAEALLDAIQSGQSFSVVRGWIDAPKSFEFRASGPGGEVSYGGVQAGLGDVTVSASVSSISGARVVVLRDGREVTSGEGRAEVRQAAPGVYRAEVRLKDRVVPWIVSNAIRVGIPGEPGPVPPIAAKSRAKDAETNDVIAIPFESWAIEKHPTTQASIAVANNELRLRYELGGGAPAGQYVALATSASGDDSIREVVFSASASRPLRLSVQIRVPGGVDGQRWRKSVYVDQVAREFRIPLSQLEPVDRRSQLRPTSTRVQSILLVIDTVNARPGDRGELVLSKTGFVKVKP